MIAAMRWRDPLLPVQLLGMVAVVGMEALAQAQLPPETPALTRGLAWAIVAALLIFWLWSAPRRRRLLAADEDRRADHLLFLVLWAGSFGTVGQIFLLFPWLPDAERLFIVMFCIATVAVLAFAAVERPPPSGAPLLLPLVIPAGLISWYLFNPVPLRWPVIAAVLVFTALFWLLRAQVQRLVNQTHAAMIGADTARTEAIAAREAKTRFLAAAWHDLGQPVQAARLYVDQALRSPDAERRAHAASAAQRAFVAVETQLRALLEHLRLESGVVTAAREAVPLAPLLDEVVALAHPAASAAGIALHAEVGALVVTADRALLQRALSNLVDNAVGHSGGTKVAIAASASADRVALRVADNGHGITPAQLPGLFDDFRQGERLPGTGRFQPHGFGLGLASARRIARLMGGDLRFEDAAGGGACFVLELSRG
jgi:signal transduction histidine kinase